MKYAIYIKHVVWELLATKYEYIDAVKTIRRNFNESDRASFMIIEDDGKSQFPIVFIQSKEDYYKFIEDNAEELTNKKNSGKMKMK